VFQTWDQVRQITPRPKKIPLTVTLLFPAHLSCGSEMTILTSFPLIDSTCHPPFHGTEANVAHCICRVYIVLGILALSSPRASAQLTFNITNQGGATAQMMTGFQQAAAIWSSVLNDPVTINIKVNAAALQTGQIGATSAFFDPYAYSSVRNALISDRTSARDISSTNALQSGSSFTMLINRTKNNPNGVVSATPYFDTGAGGPGDLGAENNNTIRLTSANAKALGLIAGDLAGSDGTITFSTLKSYDFDRSNGINAA